ncbi:hypothetical protein NDU88_000561 [Pleurodeles waltl]|uniref:Uncharacterized protein n=1 Tax=Pleurodeles waltl TaxID=8319 RepID=A0AAV7S6G9_PLEWA|nr:hypothetical protein NDU88_000561 [Pleurodeles waltl]
MQAAAPRHDPPGDQYYWPLQQGLTPGGPEQARPAAGLGPCRTEWSLSTESWGPPHPDESADPEGPRRPPPSRRGAATNQAAPRSGPARLPQATQPSGLAPLGHTPWSSGLRKSLSGDRGPIRLPKVPPGQDSPRAPLQRGTEAFYRVPAEARSSPLKLSTPLQQARFWPSPPQRRPHTGSPAAESSGRTKAPP